MRMLATASLLVLLSGTAWAQQTAAALTPPTPTDLTKGTVMTDADLHAAIAKVGNDRPIVSTRVFTLGGASPYAVNVEHRRSSAPGRGDSRYRSRVVLRD